MSSGVFIRSRYQTTFSSATIAPIRIQPETTGLTIDGVINTPPTGAATTRISAVVSRGKRSRGLTPRKVAFKFTAETPITGLYKADSILVLPWLNPFPDGGFAEGAAGTYLGEAIELVGTYPEYVK